MKLERQRITFILCVNDEEEYAECRYYLNRLKIPDEYRMDIVEVQGASSMAAGYNEGMKRSDAKYKIYLHQDVFIRNEDFISELLKAFSCDERIGLLGMVGNTEKINSVMEWNAGKVMENRGQWKCGLPSQEDGFVEVQAVDGLLLATQYDIPWREDLFTGWDLYDISQCMEFRKAGYKTAVPWQKEAWCYHDTTVPDLTAYYDYYKIFVHEYGELAGFSQEERMADYTLEKEYAVQIAEMRAAMKELFTTCGWTGRNRLREIFMEKSLGGWNCLKEYEAIIRIDWLEEQNCSRIRFWREGMSVAQLHLELRRLRHALKRIEYGDSTRAGQILKKYSWYALEDTCERYIVDKERVYRELDRNQQFEESRK